MYVCIIYLQSGKRSSKVLYEYAEPHHGAPAVGVTRKFLNTDDEREQTKHHLIGDTAAIPLFVSFMRK